MNTVWIWFGKKYFFNNFQEFIEFINNIIQIITFFVSHIKKMEATILFSSIPDQIMEYSPCFFNVTFVIIWYFTIVFSPTSPYNIN